MLDTSSETVVVSGRRQFAIRVAAIEEPRSMRITVVLDSRFEWTFDQSGWRPLAVGSDPQGAFLWSAREVITLPVDATGEPVVALSVDEDLLAVFRDGVEWSLVCETSLRRVIGREEVDRIDFDGVIERCFWAGEDEIVVRLDDGSERRTRWPGAGDRP